MKITIYELLGMVKDGKAPKEVKYNGEEYKITKILLEDNNYYCNYINEDMECLFPINANILNDEIEILEEEKKIKKLNDILRVDDLIPPVDENMYKIWQQTIKNHNKINEIIDKLNESEVK